MPEITVSVLADSTWGDERILTMQLEYPRLIHSQLKTYGLLRSNSSSSRAIPTKRMIAITEESEPYIPASFVADGKGMGGTTLVNSEVCAEAQGLIKELYDTTRETVRKLNKIGVHKQHANRYLEPWSMIRVIATGAEAAWKHIVYQRLRDDGSVQPEFVELAQILKVVLDDSKPVSRTWHIPYLAEGEMPTRDAVLYACARAARESYRREEVTDDFLERLMSLWDEGHYTPFEHCAFWWWRNDSDQWVINPLTVGALTAVKDKSAPDMVSDSHLAKQSRWRQVRHIGLREELDNIIAYAATDFRNKRV
jgi:hypothetical protein